MYMESAEWSRAQYYWLLVQYQHYVNGAKLQDKVTFNMRRAAKKLRRVAGKQGHLSYWSPKSLPKLEKLDKGKILHREPLHLSPRHNLKNQKSKNGDTLLTNKKGKRHIPYQQYKEEGWQNPYVMNLTSSGYHICI